MKEIDLRDTHGFNAKCLSRTKLCLLSMLISHKQTSMYMIFRQTFPSYHHRNLHLNITDLILLLIFILNITKSLNHFHILLIIVMIRWEISNKKAKNIIKHIILDSDVLITCTNPATVLHPSDHSPVIVWIKVKEIDLHDTNGFNAKCLSRTKHTH